VVFGRLSTWAAGRGVQLFFGAVILWVIGVFLLITFQPEPGAGSAEELQTAFRSGVTEQDADALARLFADGTIGDDYPATLLDRLTAAAPSSWDVGMRLNAGRRELILSAADECVSWEVTRSGDRWFLDGVPPLQSAC
jgi:hypothetical protein